jgi:hypothetical protein
VVGDGAYGDRNSAEADMTTIHVCSSQAADAGTRRQDAAPPTPLR